ncbi:MAG: hypothetical protein HQ477_01235 [Chloroflexi bacterium]|jgi:hypothetical protein|nr:hypothetical protein [Chloroflexota bacterium]
MKEPEPISNMSDTPDIIAPDGSEIRLLKSPIEESSMVHALIHPGTTTHAVHHLTVEKMGLR